MSERDGYWYTYADGRREWRDAPRCSKCGGPVDNFQRSDWVPVEEGQAIAIIACVDCGTVATWFSKPTAADIARGVELAERYGW